MKINSKIHFIGISGIGMSGIAELMLDKGYLIQGSDISVNENNVMKISFREKFTFRRGRLNCSLNESGKWKWFGHQFTIEIAK